jgi:hypothetical protein
MMMDFAARKRFAAASSYVVRVLEAHGIHGIGFIGHDNLIRLTVLYETEQQSMAKRPRVSCLQRLSVKSGDVTLIVQILARNT